MNHPKTHEYMKHKKKFLKPLIITLCIFLIVLIISTGVDVINKIKESKYIGQNVEQRNTIVVSETGEVYATPDLGVITASVTNEAETVADAIAENTERMNSVIVAVKALGIEDKDIKTISFNIYPRYTYTERGYGDRVLVGYEVVQQLQVKIRDLDKIGSVIQEATDAGANDISGLQLTIDNKDELKNQARQQAIEKAKTKAEELTSRLGVKLGKIISFSESSFSPYYQDRFYAEGIGAASAVPDIQAGENKISVSVNIIYEIY